MTRSRDERGATAVTVALLMVPILGFAGLAIDVGGMYWENGQLQNGADAAAVAVAQRCASTANACTGATTTAGGFANANANDALADATVTYKNGTPASGQVTVRTSTRTADGVVIDHRLWNAMTGLLGLPEQFTTEYTQATAIWGSPSLQTATLPLAISACDFARMGIQTGANPPHDLILYNVNDRTSACPAGSAYPSGGFGWLDKPSASVCYARISNGNQAGNDPGNGNVPNGCDSMFTASLVGKTLLVPIFTAATGNGNNAVYTLSGFGAFVITGWRFSGGSSLPYNSADPTLTGTKSCNGSCRGIQGYFTRFVSVDAVGVPIDTTRPGTCTYGACIVALTQ